MFPAAFKRLDGTMDCCSNNSLTDLCFSYIKPGWKDREKEVTHTNTHTRTCTCTQAELGLTAVM